MDAPLRVMNTRTHSVEEFRPREPGVVRMYVCGPSVYDEAHLGHARSYVVYDAMKRALQAMGYRVVHVQNFTDVEENVTRRAKEAGMEPLAFADRMIERFFRDMDALRIRRADHYPRVSQHIKDIQRIVRDLEDKGLAYVVDCGDRPHVTAPEACDVYFDVTKKPDFGELIGATVEDLTVERPLRAGDRRNPLDFALWKSRDDWGVTWPSPWGMGRPGWHVECAAMSIQHLGADFDIHGGGLDLVFPHHESERAIGEAWTGQRYCGYYLHNGFVTVENEKMSKSLGNFVTIRALLDQHDAEALRVLLLGAPYRASLDYGAKGIEAATKRVQRWRARMADVRRHASGAPVAALADAEAAFWSALKDDFRFERALDTLDRALDEAAALRGAEAAGALAALRRMGDALGVLWDDGL